MIPSPVVKEIAARLDETKRHQSAASDPGLSVWVSANAGTGKTHVLTMRVLRLLLQGAEPQSILCLTYTKAAAALMSQRVFGELAKWVTLPQDALIVSLADLTGAKPSTGTLNRARTLFASTIETPGGLKIQTIHAFAERLLQRFPLEAGVAPGFTILDESESRALRRQAIDAALAEASGPAAGELGKALAAAITYASGDRFDDILTAAMAKRDWLDAAGRMGFGEAGKSLRDHLGIRPDVDRDKLEAGLAGVLSSGDLARLQSILCNGAASDGKLADGLGQAARASSHHARAEALAKVFFTVKGEPRDRLMTNSLRAEHSGAADIMARAQEKFTQLSQELTALKAANATTALYQLASNVLQHYTVAKARRAALDFDDLIARTVGLLRMKDVAQWVLFKLDSALSHILVDESQDTAPTQWRIVEALAQEFFSGLGAREDVRTVFAVGDEKQSIYSFQGAEAAEFARMGERFTQLATQAGAGWRRVPLNLSFRTVDPILRAVDMVFADPARVPGVFSAGVDARHFAKRAGQAGMVEIWPVEKFVAPSVTNPWQPLEERSQASPVVRLANRIAATIEGWLRKSEQLPSEGRPIEPGDILILVRKRHPFAGPMTAALKARGISVAGSDRIQLTEQIAVQDLLALGDFLTLPEDDLSLASVLKSPIFGFDDTDLMALAPSRKATLWKSLIDAGGTSAKYGSAVQTLKRWRSKADFMPPYEFIASLLDKDGVRAKLIARLGPDAAEAIDEFAGLALTYDDQSPPSLSGFLHWLRDGSREIKRDMEHGRNEVRVMTVHGAKGLEAPVVFLPDTCSTQSAQSQGGGLTTLEGLTPPETADPFLWCVKGSGRVPAIAAARAALSARETAERNRLLYVAMTRARDRLYIAGFEGRNGPARGCWYELVSDGLLPVAKKVDLTEGTHVWRLDAGQSADLEVSRQSEHATIAPSPPPPWAGMAAPREPQLAVPLAPSRLAPLDVNEEGDPLPQAPPCDPLAEPSPGPPVPGAPEQNRFLRGTLTHALLQYLPALAPSGWAGAAAAFLEVRGDQLPAPVRARMIEETLAVLNHREFAPIFGPKSQPEVPIVASIPRPKGAGPDLKITGHIDRLVDTGSAILIVDFKTNSAVPAAAGDVADIYLFQLAAYRLALSRIFPNRPVRAALLWTRGPSLMAISPDILDDYAARLWTLDSERLDG